MDCDERNPYSIYKTLTYRYLLILASPRGLKRKLRRIMGTEKLESIVALRLKEGTPPIEIIRPEIICPWTELLKIYITKGTEVGKLEHNHIAQEARDNPGHVLAYTDGSKINGEVGASACIPELGAKAANYIGTN
jgi:hypothetical protein